MTLPRFPKTFSLKAFFISCASLFSSNTFATITDLEQSIQSVEQQSKPLQGYSFFVTGEDFEFGVTKGQANPAGEPLTQDHIFRIASVTKTYTAATTLRLIEAGKLNLDNPIASLVNPNINKLLTSDGYLTSEITIRQLLSHTAGLFDHAQSPNYLNQVLNNPALIWTREQQLSGAIEWGQPLTKAGAKYSYSDTGYILLGHVIENVTGLSLPQAVRQYLDLDAKGLASTIWEQGDSNDVPHHLRVHQFFEGADTYAWDPTMDLYGGGGLVATPKDMARFYQALFNGEIFEHKATLHLMLSHHKIPSRSPYLLGVFKKRYGELSVYEHSGFWGTLVMHDPKSRTTIAGAAVEAKEFKQLVEIMSGYLLTLHKKPSEEVPETASTDN